MPIKPEYREFYGREWKRETRPRILLRAQNRCEACGVPNNTRVIRAAGWWTNPRTADAIFTFMNEHEPGPFYWHPPDGREAQLLEFHWTICREVWIRIGVAHLNHTPGDDRPENLKALCQWCHLNYDKRHHHETRGARKDAARPLFAAAKLA